MTRTSAWGLVAVSLVVTACSEGGRTPTPAPTPVPTPVREDPLLRMPGTQPGQVALQGSAKCYECHGYGPSQTSWTNGKVSVRSGRTDFDEYNVFKGWQGSMMGNSARDPLMFACFTVAAQDSKFAIGTPNAVDLCMRCHFPKGWLEGRSSTLNASAMQGEDYDGIQCSFCHRLQDPFATATAAGPRELGAGTKSTWKTLFDEQNAPGVPAAQQSANAATATLLADLYDLPALQRFGGGSFYENLRPFAPAWDENGAGQFVVSADARIRGPFPDTAASGAAMDHEALYSRYHKGKFICGTCHDVSNPILANLSHAGAKPGAGVALPTETQPAYAWSHVERTFSEFRLSAYNAPGGAAGKGNFKPATQPRDQPAPAGTWETDQPGNFISKCQDCHMCSRWSIGANDPKAPIRPQESAEQPNTWTPCHALTGGNVWMSEILASIAPGDSVPDSVNKALLLNRAAELTMDPMQGTWTALLPANIGATVAPGMVAPDISAALTLAATRNRGVLGNAASITDLAYDPATGALGFRVQNNTGHKLISGFPEGRRMFVNVKVKAGGQLLRELNPYDYAVGTLKGLPGIAVSPALGASEAYVDELVYEVHMDSAITGEHRTFHFALATGRTKDNRIPPKGFDVRGAAARLVEPVWGGSSRPDYFTAAEYAGGYDQVQLTVPAGADTVEVRVYYQTTSREYIEFLRDEINGTGNLTLPRTAYVAQSDPFFAGLRRWGDTIFALWEHNKDRDGGRPFLMTGDTWTAPPAARAGAAKAAKAR